MEPNRFGRILGIGVRVGSRMVKERATQANNKSAPQAQATAAANPSTAAATAPRPAAPPPPPRPAKNYTEPARRVGAGTRNFRKAFLGPLKHVSGTLWLEITGLFFALFATFFVQNAWKTRASALHGPEHAHFLLYVVIALVFIYFCVTSFVKASRRGKRATR